jgi:hypothetical protein
MNRKTIAPHLKALLWTIIVFVALVVYFMIVSYLGDLVGNSTMLTICIVVLSVIIYRTAYSIFSKK